ncbi:Tgs1 protein [Mycena indigotica]|uniref:Trimethylguanosine synthase n=1 Tax=Mycena indigotica TaxID=2126181 RepID=A0A8H6T455_9AGAR|nr:Tgs1 protein [Mycena indigotica]KAF7309582.1 Tgs1 protein [Mycena indigotica]
MGKRPGTRVGGLARFLEPASNTERPTKKQRTDSEVQSWTWIKKYDASGLVPHYQDEADVPEHLQKYFAQRTRFFSLYSSPPGCLLDEEGWYSITPELIADRIAERCRCDTILDAFCGVGGNAIAFAQTCERGLLSQVSISQLTIQVIALDISPTRLALARHNAQIYGVADRIEFILADYLAFASSYLSQTHKQRKIDVVFLSPPWGGPGYISGDLSSPVKPEVGTETKHPNYSLASIKPINGTELFQLSRRITRNVAYYLPRNTRIDEIGALVVGPPEREMVEIEEEWMGSKLKALVCFTGGLANGQPELFHDISI